MKRQARNKVLASFISVLLVLSLIITVPYFNVNADTTSTQTVSTDYALEDNVQDGVMLQAWNWSYDTIRSYLPAIAAAGYTTVQTSPVQQPKDYSASWTDVTGTNGQWWKLYQPVSFSIAQNSWLGDADDLKELCDAADQYGVKIICDVVLNHMGNDGSSVTGLDSEVAQYESTIYNNASTYTRSYVDCNDNSIEAVVHGNVGMPDLVTENTYIQGRAISLLEECIDCGVDGFRFDAAKHIETSSDGAYASNFWNNVVGTATSYAKSTKGIDLYCYGEILNTVGTGRSYSAYTSLMSITDNVTGNTVRENVASGNASGASSSYYYTEQDADHLVLWAESHDTYTANTSSSVSTENINKTWAIVASRADATAFYFARPGSATMGNCGSTEFEATEVSAVNHFHNNFVGAYEYLSNSGSIAMNERYFTNGGTDGGAVLVNVNGTSTTVSNMTVNRLGDGTYTDQITGNEFTVSNGKISGQIGSTGIAVVYNGTISTTPANTISPNGGTFSTDTLDVTVGLSNATSGTYQVGSDGTTKTYTADTTFTIGEDMEAGDTVTIYMTATDGSTTTTKEATFTKVEQEDTMTIYFTNNYNWSNVYAYYWGSSESTVSWPGTQMTYVKQNEYNQAVYSIEVPSDITGLIFNSGNGGVQTVDITSGYYDGIGYYLTGSSSPYSVGTYTY